MSSESSFIASLSIAQTSLYKYGGPILMAFGIVSCTLSLTVFTQKNLRKNSCSIYLIAYNISNLLLIFTSILVTTLATGYFIDPGSYNLIICRIRYYTMYLFDVLGPSYLLLASIDRILLTSSNARIRQRSTCRSAHVCIIIMTLFWALAHSHSLVFTNILQIAPGVVLCYFQPGIYLTLVSYYSLIIKGILFPLLMLGTGLWTVRNVRNVSRIKPAPALTTTGATAIRSTLSVRSKDRQLIKILLIDTAVYIIFSIMVSVALMYQQINQYQPQTYAQTVIQNFLLIVGVFTTYIPACIGFYTNLLVSKTFRHEAKNALMCK
ncbi:unnamed protein product [Adineta steineri]|uniref:G-protein coupled receptors family 1 profile domain-containing protein n=1 Tax=Adineta steineri TaxID=433720 RepID=A0A818XXI9_9BILA|nr:unnamed protein product [Adineta steineri]